MIRSLLLSLIPFFFLPSFIGPNAVVVAQTQQNTTQLPVGSCTPDIPCSNGACCDGASGFCGFGPKFCGSDVCTSNCDALAECGEFAPPDSISCPLNVCCSQFGFCGTTTDFCGDGCQSNCGSAKQPSCGVDASTATAKRIGYYEGWAASRSCMAFTPEQIPADALTHVNFAFALISSSFEIIEMTAGDKDLWKRTTALKKDLPALKVFLSIGGWTFNDPPTQHIFSDMVASDANTNKFLASALSIMEQYAFDGLDIDWEYPGASDRGGIPADTANYVKFMQTVKASFKVKNYGLTFTAPSSYWYLQHFDIPGMLEHADWVNVMTYDLHGVWDGVDPYIGYVVLAHTNLTEIEQAFDLYWRVNVDASQMVMGMAFYGRSFALSTSSCSDPGCPWTSGADAGPCSKNPGSLMWAEIDAIVGPDTHATLHSDDKAAVKYAVFGSQSNQWVSYDDVESFSTKMNYANSHCIGGTMIWSVDQDDDIFSRLESLYPDIATTALDGGNGDLEDDGSCFVTDCGSQSCFSDVKLPPNSIHAAYIVGDVYYNPLQGNCDLKESDQAQVCCPTNMGGSCTKRGYKDATTACSPQCEMEEILVAMDIVGKNLDEKCSSGTTGLCCAGGSTVAPADCIFTPCSDSPATSCPADSPNFQTSLSVANGPCTDGKSQGFCCEKPFPWTNCEWRGVPPLCGGNSCNIGQITVFQDALGDGDSPCTGGNMRSYCCDVPQALPVPFKDVFPDDVKDSGNDLFNVDFDPDVGNSFSEEGSTSTFKEDDNEDNGAFGEVFIDSPNPSAVSSLDLASNWVLSGCDPKSDQPQQVVAHCSKADSDACQHVFIGGAANTIVQLPRSCGLGPYARVVSLDLHANQSILAKFRNVKPPPSGNVFQFSFDYNFAAIPAENGPVYMRADVTDMPGYWDSVVDSPPERREWLKSRGLWTEPSKSKRWWGAFKTWLSKINQVESDNSQSRTFFWSDTWTIFHQDLHCDGPPTFDASLDISVNGQTQLRTRYGFYLQGQIVPPQVTAAYVYFNAGGKAAATFTMAGTAKVTWNSDTVEFARFGFPGLYYPGLLTIGPSLVLNGYITGELSLTGTLTTGLTYTFPEVNYALGKSSDDFDGNQVTPSDPSQGYKYSFGYNVDLSGSLFVHVVPTVQLGITVLGGSLIDANAYVAADLYAGVEITGSVSKSQALEVCVNPHYGLILTGGVTGSLLYWESSPLSIDFYKTDYTYMSKCFGAVDEPSASGRRELVELSASAGTLASYPATHPEPRIVVEDKKENTRKEIQPISGTEIGKRALIPPLVGTDFLCPATDDSIGKSNWDNDIYSDIEPESNNDDGVYRRETLEDDIYETPPVFNHTLYERVQVASCGTLIKFDGFPYTGTNPSGYWNLASPTTLDYRFAPYPNKVGLRPGANTFGREHVYEMQLITQFIDSLASAGDLWQNAAGTVNFCTWANTQLNRPSPYAAVVTGGVNTVVNRLRQCEPSNTQSLLANGNNMRWLEATANGMKARSFNTDSIKEKAKFDTYSFSKKVFEIRAASGVITYLESGVVADELVRAHQCMRQVWTDWYNAYLNDNTVDAPNRGQFPLPQQYRLWVIAAVQTSASKLVTGIEDMITWYEASAGGANNAENVDLNWGVLAATGNHLVSGADLRNAILNPVSDTDFFTALVSRL
ncbi:hypothetical protein B0H19DRAFT_442211 [Mycena capillaripes]|nr:hypothetical protein B0H19DRAFT_442211 [Mycena capillaripes]